MDVWCPLPFPITFSSFPTQRTCCSPIGQIRQQTFRTFSGRWQASACNLWELLPFFPLSAFCIFCIFLSWVPFHFPTRRALDSQDHWPFSASVCDNTLPSSSPAVWEGSTVYSYRMSPSSWCICKPYYSSSHTTSSGVYPTTYLSWSYAPSWTSLFYIARHAYFFSLKQLLMAWRVLLPW